MTERAPTKARKLSESRAAGLPNEARASVAVLEAGLNKALFRRLAKLRERAMELRRLS